jgi:hypothetical protein
MGEAKLVVQALRQVPNYNLDYYAWLDVGYALKGALGHAGWPLFRDWSATSVKNDPEATERAWNYMKPERCGWRFLLRLAEGEAHARR